MTITTHAVDQHRPQPVNSWYMFAACGEALPVDVVGVDRNHMGHRFTRDGEGITCSRCIDVIAGYVVKALKSRTDL